MGDNDISYRELVNHCESHQQPIVEELKKIHEAFGELKTDVAVIKDSMGKMDWSVAFKASLIVLTPTIGILTAIGIWVYRIIPVAAQP